MILEIFESLRINQDEAKTYLALLQSGPMQAGRLARKIGRPRPSIYDHLRKLAEKGMVQESQKDLVKIFIAEPPEKIQALLNQQKERLEVQQKNFETILPALKKRTANSFVQPRFQYFEGLKGIEHVLKDMLLYYDQTTYSFWPIKKMIEALSPLFFHQHNKSRIENRLSVQAIWPTNELISFKKHPSLGAGQAFLREIRIAPPQIDQASMGYWIYGQKVAFLSSRKEAFGFIIESAEMAEMMKIQHQVIWAMSKPLKTPIEDVKDFLKEL